MITSRSYPPLPVKNIAFIGLGVMGHAMAAHLQAAGQQVCVFNRSADKARAWVAQYGGTMASTVAQAVQHADLVLSCVGNDDDLHSLTLGSHAGFAAMKRHAVWVDHTTTSAAIAQKLAVAAQQQGLSFIDAPVSGGSSGAQQGLLTVMCGGDAQAFAKVESTISCFARAVTLMGPSGSGQLCKMVNQIAIAGVLQGLAEALAFGSKAGLDMPKAVQVIAKGAAQSWQLENRSPTMLEGKFDFGFAVDLMRKDLGLCLAQARQIGAQLPATALVDQFYADLQTKGDGRLDTSSLIRRLV